MQQPRSRRGASSFSERLAQTTKDAHRLHFYRDAHVRIRDAMVQSSLHRSPEQLKMASVCTKPFLVWGSPYGPKMAEEGLVPLLVLSCAPPTPPPANTTAQP